jgi:hypothetical protein
MTGIYKLVKKLKKIEKKCKKNKKLNSEMEKYCLKKGQPSSYNDALEFIEHYEKVEKSIKNTG